MAYAHTSRSLNDGLLGRIRSLRDTAADYINRRRVYRTTLNELQTLNPRELTDLGLNPSMIRQIAYQAAWGDK